MADSSADRSVGNAYLLSDWATDRWVTAVAGRLRDADLYQACLIFQRRLIARRQPSPGDRSLGDRAPKWVWPSSEKVYEENVLPISIYIYIAEAIGHHSI